MFRLSLVLLLYSIFAVAAPTDNVTLCYESEHHPPYYLGTNRHDADNPGLLPSLVQKAFEEAGYEVVFIRQPWLRCLKEMKAGKVDGTIGAAFSEERAKIARFPRDENGMPDESRRVVKVNYSYYIHKKNINRWTKSEDILKVENKISSPLGYISSDLLHTLPVTFIHGMSLEQGLEMVARERLEAYVGEQYIIEHALKSLALDGMVVEAPFVLLRQPVYVPLSMVFVTRNPEKAEQVWSLIGQYRKQFFERADFHEAEAK